MKFWGQSSPGGGDSKAKGRRLGGAWSIKVTRGWSAVSSLGHTGMSPNFIPRLMGSHEGFEPKDQAPRASRGCRRLAEGAAEKRG